MDEFAFYDIPNSIDYILSTTGAASLSYIGFSQGTAQAFATLSIHPTLNQKVDVFIALAPAMSPAGLSNGIVDALIKASPQVLFLLFGRRSILSSATMWQSILYPPIFVRVIDMGLSFLFGWHARNMSTSQKLAAYPHLYSFTSTKSVVHWFQIIRTKSFQMYDDDVQPPLTIGSVSKYTKVARFPTRNIKTPIVLVYGGSDSLVDIGVMLKELPPHTVATEIPHYEHLDFLWAREVDTLVFPHVYDALESFSDAGHTKEDFAKFRAARHASLGASAGPPSYASEDDSLRSPVVSTYAAAAALSPRDPNTLPDEGPKAIASTIPVPLSTRKRVRIQEEESISSPSSPTLTGHVKMARATEPTPVDGTSDSEGLVGYRMKRSASTGSHISFEAGTKGSRGITLGVGKAVGGVVSTSVQGLGSLTGSDSDGRSSGKRGKK
jgi:lysosomal acid lipase/cholesteryl ester hydrolase